MSNVKSFCHTWWHSHRSAARLALQQAVLPTGQTNTTDYTTDPYDTHMVKKDHYQSLQHSLHLDSLEQITTKTNKGLPLDKQLWFQPIQTQIFHQYLHSLLGPRRTQHATSQLHVTPQNTKTNVSGYHYPTDCNSSQTKEKYQHFKTSKKLHGLQADSKRINSFVN